jgi:hypothetical protein
MQICLTPGGGGRGLGEYRAMRRRSMKAACFSKKNVWFSKKNAWIDKKSLAESPLSP